MVMQTKTAGPGRFAAFDLAGVPSPCFVTDLARLEDNLAVLKDVADQSGAQILTALKAFSLWSVAPLVSRYLDGACASGLYEARLARTHYARSADHGVVSCFAPAYKPQELAELADICDHIIFNSPQQIDRFAAQARAGGAEIGLRVNPCLPLGEVEKYDPSAPRSRLGLPISWHHGSWFQTVRDQRFDLIVSNPPYIAEDDPHLGEGDLPFEPQSALRGGPDGLSCLRTLINEAQGQLRPGGWFLVEHGWDQGSAVRDLMMRSEWISVETRRDLAGHERVTGAQRPYG